jgi:hypothetical protein
MATNLEEARGKDILVRFDTLMLFLPGSATKAHVVK